MKKKCKHRGIKYVLGRAKCIFCNEFLWAAREQRSKIGEFTVDSVGTDSYLIEDNQK